MLHKIFHALGGAADEVGAPDEEYLRTVLPCVEVFGSQRQLALMELLADIVFLAHAGLCGFTAKGEGAAVECR